MHGWVKIEDWVKKIVAASKGGRSWSEFSKDTGVPTHIIGHILRNGNLESTRSEYLQRLTGKRFRPHKIESWHIRKPAQLYKYIHNISEEKLASQLGIDQRAFSGLIKTIQYDAYVNLMNRFYQQGLEDRKIDRWYHEMIEDRRVSIDEFKPIVEELSEITGIGAAHFLGPEKRRYESKELSTVSGHTYDRANRLLRRMQKASPIQIEKFKAYWYGKEPRVPYSALEEKIEVLQRHKVSLKNLLGRSPKHYIKGEGKTVSQDTAKAIDAEYRRVKDKLGQVTNVLSNYLFKKATIDDVDPDACTFIDKAHELIGIDKSEFDSYIYKHREDVRKYALHCKRGFELPNHYIKKISQDLAA